MDMRTPLHSVDAKVTELRWRHHPSKGLQGCEPGAAAGVGAAFVSLYRQLAGHLVEAVQRDAITERVLMQVHTAHATCVPLLLCSRCGVRVIVCQPNQCWALDFRTVDDHVLLASTGILQSLAYSTSMAAQVS